MSEDLIATPDRRVRVFVSSALAELAEERRAARQGVSALRLTPIMFELRARPHPPARAVPLLPRAERRLRHLRDRIGIAVWPLLRPMAEGLVQTVQAALDPSAYAREQAAGAALRPAAALAYALDATEAPRPAG